MPAINTLIHGDIHSVLPTLSTDSVDLVFADPPYNLQLRGDLLRPNHTLVDAVDDEWDQFKSFAAYDRFTQAWLTQVRRIMKPTATIWVSGTYHNIFRVGNIMQDLGFWVLNFVTWYKYNAMPNFRGTRLKNDAEFIIWAKYDETSRYTFNHHSMKRFNAGKQLGSVWQINACGGDERLRDDAGNKLHPTQKPEDLLYRVLLASSLPDDLVFDPFTGTGTTLAMAKHLRRRWLGIERDPRYYHAAQARIAQMTRLPADSDKLRDQADVPQPRVAFKKLLQRGYLQVGQCLYLGGQGTCATVCANAKLQAGNDIGSIHSLARTLKQTQSANGWLEWYYEDEAGERRPIDHLRDQYRANELPSGAAD